MTASLNEAARLKRQSRFFGDEGQRRISANRVGVVGCGGIGSHVVQQLCFLGVSDFVLVDCDEIDKTSRNRVVGSLPRDVLERARKVNVARDMILAINPSIKVKPVDATVVSEKSLSLLEDCDFIFSCVDLEVVRSDINLFCNAYGIDFVDIATEIHPEGTLAYGGQVLFSINGEMCLQCKGMLNQQVMRLELMSKKKLTEEATIYGIPLEHLSDSGPSVIALNGMLASLAVFEWSLEISEVRKARRSLVYHGELGIVAIDIDLPQADCTVCKGLRGNRQRPDFLSI